MKQLSIALIAVLCNVSAQILMKLASQSGFQIRDLSTYFSWQLMTSVILYGLSFLLTLQVLSQAALSIASPLMAGLTFVGIALASYLILHEAMNAQKIVGMLVIFVGIFILTKASM